MPNSSRIIQLTEQLAALEKQIGAINKKPDPKRTKDDNVLLTELLSQRALMNHELQRLKGAQQANISAFFGGL